MASSTLTSLLALFLVLLPMTAKGDHDPFTFYEHVCDEVECGKGNCTVNSSYPLNFICECEPGWKRTRDDDDDDDDKYETSFLPCVIPNCTLNYGGCQPAPPPVPEKEVPHNISLFDPCYWAYCGQGKCTKNKTYSHTCECEDGFYNLLNITQFPCYSECTLGSDCARLGIKVSNSTADESDDGQASSILPGKFHWILILMMSVGMVMWK